MNGIIDELGFLCPKKTVQLETLSQEERTIFLAMILSERLRKIYSTEELIGIDCEDANLTYLLQHGTGDVDLFLLTLVPYIKYDKIVDCCKQCNRYPKVMPYASSVKKLYGNQEDIERAVQTLYSRDVVKIKIEETNEEEKQSEKNETKNDEISSEKHEWKETEKPNEIETKKPPRKKAVSKRSSSPLKDELDIENKKVKVE